MYTYCILGCVLKNTHCAVHCIMLHGDDSLHKYMCVVTMQQESQSLMAYTLKMHSNRSYMFFLLSGFNRCSVFCVVQTQKCRFLFCCFSQTYAKHHIGAVERYHYSVWGIGGSVMKYQLKEIRFANLYHNPHISSFILSIISKMSSHFCLHFVKSLDDNGFLPEFMSLLSYAQRMWP